MPLCSTVVGQPSAGYHLLADGHCESGGWLGNQVPVNICWLTGTANTATGATMMGSICHVCCPTRLSFLLSVCSKFLFLEFPPLRLTSCLVFAFSPLRMWCVHHCSNRRAFFPSGWYLLHALGPLCRRGLLCDRIRKTYIYTLHADFCFFPFPFIWKSISTPHCMRRPGCQCAATLTKEQ